MGSGESDVVGISLTFTIEIVANSEVVGMTILKIPDELFLVGGVKVFVVTSRIGGIRLGALEDFESTFGNVGGLPVEDDVGG